MSFVKRTCSQYVQLLACSLVAVLWLVTADPVFAEKAAAQSVFASPEQAMSALVTALKSGDVSAMEKVLGPGSQKLLTSGDPVADKEARERFLAAAADSTQSEKREDGKVFFEIGKDAWPFPIPVVAAGGNWRFDSKAGAEEIINRRIGSNELNAINVCLAYVDAQTEYASEDRNRDGFLEYAQQFASDPGMRNGLYWPVAAGEEESPMGPLVVNAEAAHYSFSKVKGKRTPYYGYYYRILKAQGPHATGGALDYIIRGHMIGGFALVAFPTVYGSSGVMTFIVNHEGIVYQKDLGPNTAEIAEKMKYYDPDSSWKKAQ